MNDDSNNNNCVGHNVLPFWKREDGYGVFCQWYLVRMTLGGIEYNCCEQYMMAAKVSKFGCLLSMSHIVLSGPTFRRR